MPSELELWGRFKKALTQTPIARIDLSPNSKLLSLWLHECVSDSEESPGKPWTQPQHPGDIDHDRTHISPSSASRISSETRSGSKSQRIKQFPLRLSHFLQKQIYFSSWTFRPPENTMSWTSFKHIFLVYFKCFVCQVFFLFFKVLIKILLCSFFKGTICRKFPPVGIILQTASGGISSEKPLISANIGFH